MHDTDCLDIGIETLTTDHFQDIEAREIFQVMKQLRDKNKVVDHEAIENFLLDSKMLVPCMRWIAERDYHGCIAKFPESVREIKEHHRARLIQSIGKKCVECPEEKSLDELASLLNPIMDDVHQVVEHSLSSVFDGDWFGQKNFPEFNLHNYDLHKKGIKPDRGISFGFPELDLITRGMKDGYYVTVGGRPGAGKTTFALNVMENAMAQGKKVGFISLEMTRHEAFLKLLSAKSNVPYTVIEEGTYYSDEIFQHVQLCAMELKKQSLFIEDGAVGNLQGVISRIRRLKRLHNIDLVCIDYIGLMKTMTRNQTTVDRLSEISTTIRSLLKELRIPGLILAQVNRDASKNNQPIRKENIKDCDQIVADSYIVILLDKAADEIANHYHEDRILGKSKKITLRLDKTRYGANTDIAMMFNGSKFRELETIDLMQNRREQENHEGFIKIQSFENPFNQYTPRSHE